MGPVAHFQGKMSRRQLVLKAYGSRKIWDADKGAGDSGLDEETLSG